MKTVTAVSAAALLALSPLAAVAGDVSAVGTGDPVIAPPVVVAPTGGLGTAGAVVLGAAGLLALAAVLADDEDSDDTTGETE